MFLALFAVLGSLGLFVVNVLQYKKSNGVKCVPPLFVLCLTGYILLIPPGLSVLLLLYLYRQLVKLVLRIRHGRKFRGLIKGGDALYTLDDSRSVINVLFVCQYHQEREESFYDIVRAALHNLYFKNPERFPKFLSSFQKGLGYSYMLKSDVALDDCVKKMAPIDKEKLGREDVLRLATECSNLPLPKENTVLWQALVGTQPVAWDSPDTKSYPVLFKVHHGVADGVSLIKFMIGAFADNPDVKVISSTTVVDSSRTSGFWSDLSTQFKELVTTVWVVAVAPTSFYTQALLKGKDRNILHGPPLSGEAILALNVEASKTYVEKARNIKRRVPNTTFSEVILTAFSASLEEYYAKNSFGQPRFITAIIPVLSGASTLKQLTPGTPVDLDLKNKFSLLFLNLPLCLKEEDPEKSLLTRLQQLQTQTRGLQKSHDYLVNQWVLSVALGLFPNFLVKLLTDLMQCTVVTSVLPGPPKISFYGGCPVQDVAFWAPYIRHTGVSFSVLTYDGRFQLGLNVDKALISNEQVAQNIVNGVYRYIDLLYEETA